MAGRVAPTPESKALVRAEVKELYAAARRIHETYKHDAGETDPAVLLLPSWDELSPAEQALFIALANDHLYAVWTAACVAAGRGRD